MPPQIGHALGLVLSLPTFRPLRLYVVPNPISALDSKCVDTLSLSVSLMHTRTRTEII